MVAWTVHEGDAASAEHPATSAAARAVLADAIGHGRASQDNIPLINKLFGTANGEPHCHNRGRAVERSVLKSYRYVAAMAGERCIATAVYRHVLPQGRSRSISSPYTELLLMAVESEHRKKGFGRQLASFVKRKAMENNVAEILVIASKSTLPFWCDTPLPCAGGPMISPHSPKKISPTDA